MRLVGLTFAVVPALLMSALRWCVVMSALMLCAQMLGIDVDCKGLIRVLMTGGRRNKLFA